MTLYDFFLSSCAYRVRLALALKGLSYRQVSIDLGKGAQFARPAEADIGQPQVPVLVIDGIALQQSLAIIECLEERHPEPRLLPADWQGRARVRGIALAIACDMQPLANLRVSRHAVMLAGDEGAATAWYDRWLSPGFAALEAQLSTEAETGAFCHGEAPTLADICLVPMIFAAHRFNIDLDPYPTLTRIDASCRRLSVFRQAAPAAQPDFDPARAPAPRADDLLEPIGP
jgi:maleylpyruvate isomerase